MTFNELAFEMDLLLGRDPSVVDKPLVIKTIGNDGKLVLCVDGNVTTSLFQFRVHDESTKPVDGTID